MAYCEYCCDQPCSCKDDWTQMEMQQHVINSLHETAVLTIAENNVNRCKLSRRCIQCGDFEFEKQESDQCEHIYLHWNELTTTYKPKPVSKFKQLNLDL